VIVNGYVGGRVIAGGALAVADHHDAPENSNPGKYLGSIYANGYVGGGAEVHGAGQSAIRGLVEGGSLYVGSLAELVIAATGRVNAFDSQGVSVEGKLIIEASGELDVDGIGEISGHSGSFNDLHIFAHAESLANEGRLGPPGSGVTLARGARLYTRTPVTVPALANLDFDRGIQTGSVVAPDVLDARFRALAGSAVLHATIAAPANLGASAPLAFTVGAHNVVALTQNTVLAGNVDLQGSLRLNGHELALAGAITVASDNSPVSHYSDGADYANGSIYFEAAGSEHSALHFAGAAAALNGLGLSAEKAGGADGSGNPFNAAPVVTEVESSSGSTVAVFRSPFPPTAPGGPGGNFAPGSGALLAGSAYGGLAWINKDSRFVWRFTARVP
jgi:hypothetical protein